MSVSSDQWGNNGVCLFVYRCRLPVPMISRNDFSVWSILKQCIGKVSPKSTLYLSLFISPLSLLPLSHSLSVFSFSSSLFSPLDPSISTFSSLHFLSLCFLSISLFLSLLYLYLLFYILYLSLFSHSVSLQLYLSSLSSCLSVPPLLFLFLLFLSLLLSPSFLSLPL